MSTWRLLLSLISRHPVLFTANGLFSIVLTSLPLAVGSSDSRVLQRT